MSAFLNGILSGFTINPVIKWIAFGFVALIVVLKCSKWYANFKNKVAKGS
jgi:type IV secretory pathway TrbD component